MKTYKIVSKTQNVYQIERSDKPFPLRYLVNVDSDEMAQEICNALAADTKAAVANYNIDVCEK